MPDPNMTDGFHVVVDAIRLNGIDTIYGIAGIPVTDLMRLAQAEGIRHVGFRHEQSAGNAAAIAGYLTRKPGICMTVSAPGSLNGLIALANATTNCFPMILISGSSDHRSRTGRLRRARSDECSQASRQCALLRDRARRCDRADRSPPQLAARARQGPALASDALAAKKPALINAVIDPTAGTESGHIQSLNPRSALSDSR